MWMYYSKLKQKRTLTIKSLSYSRVSLDIFFKLSVLFNETSVSCWRFVG